MKRFKIQTQDFHQHAHEHFAWMRAQQPITKARMGLMKDAYLITRYDDVKTLLMGEQLVKDPANIEGAKAGKRAFWVPKIMRPLLQSMLSTDDPQHRRLRTLVQKAFTPKCVQALEPWIQESATELFQKALKQERFDLVKAFAHPLPVRVITKMVGVPESDLKDFHGWVDRITKPPSLFNIIGAMSAVGDFLRYIHALADKRRKDPQDDLMTALVQAEDEGDKFSNDELGAMAFLLLVAGHETTVSLITNGMLALLTHPEQLQKLREDRSLLPTAIEECLRFDGPLKTSEIYYAKRDITLHHVTIPKGATVLLGLLSANRDEKAFENPMQFDITRTINPHMAFGRGIHVCLGAALARLEAKVAFQTILDHTREITLDTDPQNIGFLPIWLLNKRQALPVRIST